MFSIHEEFENTHKGIPLGKQHNPFGQKIQSLRANDINRFRQTSLGQVRYHQIKLCRVSKLCLHTLLNTKMALVLPIFLENIAKRTRQICQNVGKTTALKTSDFNCFYLNSFYVKLILPIWIKFVKTRFYVF